MVALFLISNGIFIRPSSSNTYKLSAKISNLFVKFTLDIYNITNRNKKTTNRLFMFRVYNFFTLSILSYQFFTFITILRKLVGQELNKAIFSQILVHLNHGSP